MSDKLSKKVSPVLYIPHGGGPLPILGDAGHYEMISFLKEITKNIEKPSAILLISAHWEEDKATITSGNHPELIYDYYGFPKESYEIEYPAPGHPALAEKIFTILESNGIESELNESRGFDHGMFIPLKLMYPEADIPCVQLSLLHNLDPQKHIDLGKALSSLRKDNVMIIGSGMSFHNLREFFYPRTAESYEKNIKFNDWLIETCTDKTISTEERYARLSEWGKAPSARFCHPREEHLLPLHVCYGIASSETPTAKLVFNQEVMGMKVSGFLW